MTFGDQAFVEIYLVGGTIHSKNFGDHISDIKIALKKVRRSKIENKLIETLVYKWS